MLLILGMNKWQLKMLSIPPAKFPAAASRILDQKLPWYQCVTATVRQHGCGPRIYATNRMDTYRDCMLKDKSWVLDFENTGLYNN